MVDPVSLTLLGATALTEGVKFLYSQAGKVIERWLARRDNDEQALTDVVPTDALSGSIGPQVSIDFARLAEVETQLRNARANLSEIVDGLVDASANQENLAKIDELRRLLEYVLGQRITLIGEARQESGPKVFGSAYVADVHAGGRVTGVRVDQLRSGHAKGEVVAQQVSGEVIGLDAGDIGE